MWKVWAGTALLLLVILVSGCARNGISTDYTSITSVGLELSVIGEPRVNNTFSLVATFGLNEGANYYEGKFDNTTVWIDIPEDVDIVSGQTNWTGRIDNETHRSITIKSELVIRKEGGYLFDGYLKGPLWGGTSWEGDHAMAYIESSTFGYNIRREPPVYNQGVLVNP